MLSFSVSSRENHYLYPLYSWSRGFYYSLTYNSFLLIFTTFPILKVAQNVSCLSLYLGYKATFQKWVLYICLIHTAKELVDIRITGGSKEGMWRGIESTQYTAWLISNCFKKDRLVNGLQVWREIKEGIQGNDASLNSMMGRQQF